MSNSTLLNFQHLIHYFLRRYMITSQFSLNVSEYLYIIHSKDTNCFPLFQHVKELFVNLPFLPHVRKFLSQRIEKGWKTKVSSEYYLVHISPKNQISSRWGVSLRFADPESDKSACHLSSSFHAVKSTDKPYYSLLSR